MSKASQQNSAVVPAQVRRFGRYWLLRLIARGGMGEVFLAATTGIEGAERPCVIKFIREDHATDSSFFARFLDEARVLSQLHHPGVVQVFEAAKDPDGKPYVVTEYVEGRSLAEVRSRALRTSYPLTWPDAVALATAMAEALAYVHERQDEHGQPLGIVHRDLSPENIMVGYAGDVRLIDFGTALGENRKSHTIAGVVYAKPGYVAPEVANGHTGDARVDLYALGVMLWEMVAGRRFIQTDPAEHMAAVARNERNLPPIAGKVGAPDRLDYVIGRLTAFSLEDRYRSAREALRDLGHVLSAAPSLTNGERGVRARISHLMSNLYPSEPASSRREFARLLAHARKLDQQDAISSAPPAPAVGLASPTLPVQAENLLAGTQYELGRLLGRGASGEVYEAEHVGLGRKVALKLLAAEHASSPEYVNRFRREARALSRLNHPNLVTLHDFGQSADGRLFYAMELLEGETLEQMLRRLGPLPWRRALDIARQAADALHCAHDVGLVHRDIKPSNLFVTSSGKVKLLDFGVAHSSADGLGEAGNTDGKWTLFGTPEYMAPEQRHGGAVTLQADIYALGCVLYEMCTGTRPFDEDGTVAVLDAKSRNDPTPPRKLCPECRIPRSVERIILTALRRDPRRRQGSAAELRNEIDKILGATPTKARSNRSGRTFASMAAMVAVVVTGGALAGSWGADAVSSWIDGSLHNSSPKTVIVQQTGEATRLPDDSDVARRAAELIRRGKLAEAEKVLHDANLSNRAKIAASQPPTP